MRWLKILLVINGLVFLVRGFLNITDPTSFYLEAEAPTYARDAVRVLGVAYLTIGVVQIGTWWAVERTSIMVVSAASMFFAVGVAILAITQGSASTDAFHDLSWGSALENAAVGLLYSALMVRAARMDKAGRT